MPVASSVLDVRGLKKVFRDFWLRPRVEAVRGLDLAVRAGEVFGLLGPNGSGKTTTIKILLGLLFPSAGEVEVLQRPPTDVRVKERIGYLPEESCLYPHLSGRETLDFFGRLFPLAGPERRERTQRLLEMVGLESAADRRVGEYSKGMRRRLGLAQALINGPALLILDEPTTGLDPIGTRQMKDLIVELRSHGTTILLSSHLLADVEDVCDRVAILYGGRVRAQGPVSELLRDDSRQVIETDPLPAEALAEIRGVLERTGVALHSIAAPRQRLEAVFLRTVEKARAEGETTSGAGQGGPLPDFLRRREPTPAPAGDSPRERPPPDPKAEKDR